MFGVYKIISVVAVTLLLTACNQEDFEIVEYETPVPETYAAFENVNYQGQIDRLNQLEEMTTYMKTANGGATLEYDLLIDMFENTGGNGGGNFSFSSEKKLVDKCFAPDVALMEEYMQALVDASTSKEPAADGVAGVMTSDDGTKAYLFDENGVEHIQYIEKGLMGAVFYYQATAIYLGEEKMDADNETVVEGEGTEMEHHWDEAYGYLGVSQDFPNTVNDARFWGKYCNGRDALRSHWNATMNATPLLPMSEDIGKMFALPRPFITSTTPLITWEMT